MVGLSWTLSYSKKTECPEQVICSIYIGFDLADRDEWKDLVDRHRGHSKIVIIIILPIKE